MSFTPTPGHVLGRVGRPTANSLDLPDNGTAFLNAPLGGGIQFDPVSGSLFSLVSVDLAEYAWNFAVPLTVQFVGYRPDGSTVVTEFVTDGIIDGTGPLADFQTFYFGPEFSGLTHVEVPTVGWSLDNLVLFTGVPEPGTGAIVTVAAILMGLRLLLKRKAGP